ncbi:MAG: exopolysaccharide biosynthesis polyprenyl glycosylphosphotransferase [Geminicoccaceae bacterium]|nr:exopolysaccharide biosynthesis polyprenyl glycosylphosphotransferase [Geminicoccaceae bacterium]
MSDAAPATLVAHPIPFVADAAASPREPATIPTSAASEAALAPVERRGGALPAGLVGALLACADGALAVGTAMLVFYGFYEVRYTGSGRAWLYASYAGLAALLLVQRLWSVGAYALPRLADRRAQLRLVATSWTLAVGLLLLTLFLLNATAELSRGWLVGWYGLALASLLAARHWASGLVRRLAETGRIARRRLALVGPEPLLSEAASLLGPVLPHLRLSCHRVDPAAVAAGSLDGEAAALARTLRREAVDDVLVLPIAAAAGAPMRILDRLKELPVDLWYCPAVEPRLALVATGSFGPLPALLVSPQPLSMTEQRIKRAADLVIAATALLLLSPLLLAVAVAIRLDSPGPIFFRQLRFGFNNRPFAMLKFRTMRADQCDPSGARRTTRDDPRVTRLGRLLRRTSIDELPQLWNVLVGDMSIVGPRAHPIEMKIGDRYYHEVVEGYFARHRVRPGITGWAQIHGLRGEVDSLEKARARLAYDLEYVERWSLLLDLEILALTVVRGFGGRNAY